MHQNSAANGDHDLSAVHGDWGRTPIDHLTWQAATLLRTGYTGEVRHTAEGKFRERYGMRMPVVTVGSIEQHVVGWTGPSLKTQARLRSEQRTHYRAAGPIRTTAQSEHTGIYRCEFSFKCLKKWD
jgi:hypothetical protein